MFSLENYVDTFQQTKKILTDKVITDAVLNKAAHSFINAQTIFAKMLVSNMQEVTKYSVDSQASFWFPGKHKK
jgi:hypothetical protein